MRHGEQRNRRQETTYGPDAALRDVRTGQPVYSGPLCSRTQTVDERWCADCEQWREVRGIVGVLLGCSVCGAQW